MISSFFHIGYDGLHWRTLDEDVSFESFEYDDAEPTPLQKFILTGFPALKVDPITKNRTLKVFL